MVDTSDEEMVDADSDNPVEVFVQDTTHLVCEDVNWVESSSIQESGLPSSGSANVVIALSVGEKERGSPIPQVLLLLLRLMLEVLLLPLSRFSLMV
ncbi:hypothetical protein Tco_1364254 [Tanacetum coccineum]